MKFRFGRRYHVKPRSKFHWNSNVSGKQYGRQVLKRGSAMEKPTSGKLVCCRRLGPACVPLRFNSAEITPRSTSVFTLLPFLICTQWWQITLKITGQENYRYRNMDGDRCNDAKLVNTASRIPSHITLHQSWAYADYMHIMPVAST